MACRSEADTPGKVSHTTNLQEAAGSFEWTISHFQWLDDTPRSSDDEYGRIKSPAFVIGGHSWHVYLHPAMRGAMHEVDTGVYVALAENGRDPVVADVRIAMKGNKDTFDRALGRRIFKAGEVVGATWPRGGVLSLNHRNRHSLCISVDITLIRQISDGQLATATSASPSDPGRTLVDDLKRLLADAADTGYLPSLTPHHPRHLHRRTSEFLFVNSDLSFTVGGECVKAHRAILSARSGVFKVRTCANGPTNVHTVGCVPTRAIENVSRRRLATAHYGYRPGCFQTPPEVVTY